MSIKRKTCENLLLLACCLVTMVYFYVLKDSQTHYPTGFKVITSTTPAMIEEMAYAIRHKRMLAITGWGPHWMNAKLPMKYLKDPQKIFGETEGIYTVTRKDLKEEYPQIATLLRQFKWSAKDLERLALICYENKNDYQNGARQWMKENPDLVKAWMKDVQPQPGAKINIVNNGNHNEFGANMLLKILMEERMGCKVSFVSTTIPIAFAALADGSQDVMVTVWLPNCHGNEFARIRDKVDILGCNLTDAMSGIAVPDYAPIETIAELKQYQQEFGSKIISIEPGQGIIQLAQDAITAYGLNEPTDNDTPPVQ